MLRRRRLLALLCIAALLAVALAPLASGSFCATLVPLTSLSGAIVSVALVLTGQDHLHTLPAFAPLASRAPPAA